jgi:hypothetical protein
MKCTRCSKDIKVGEWMCNAIEKHTVESKSYYLKDAPNDPTAFSFKHARTDVHNIPPQRSEKTPEGTLQIIPGGFVTFVRGYYASDDPEIQYYLDRRNISVSKDEWEANYFTPGEKLARREQELKQREFAIKERENDFLAKVKAEKGSKAVASA